MGFSTFVYHVILTRHIVSIPRRDFWVFQLMLLSGGLKQVIEFQSLEGIFGFFNI
ncbi:hypothetical protein CKA32_000698 [Geitlerinema sp. FC II]|nr:hypothetical protein CKA32_000698 [Geitlerinema sp. FC II]